MTPKGLAARFYQLASGHGMTAPFLKERFGWVDPDTCWWCRQTREHLFKECHLAGRDQDAVEGSGPSRRQGYRGKTSRKRKERLWLPGPRPGNITVRELLSEERHVGVVLDLLRATKMGTVKKRAIVR